MDRRQFFEVSSKGVLGTALVRAVAVGSVAYLVVGCNVEQDILDWVKIGGPAIGTILQLLVGAGIIACLTCSASANIAVAAINAIATAVQNWMNAPPASKATLLGKIVTALQDALSAAITFFESVAIPDQKLATLIEGLVSLIVNALSGFIGQLGGTTAAASAKREVKLRARTIPVVPVVMKAGTFKTRFNALLTEYQHTEALLH